MISSRGVFKIPGLLQNGHGSPRYMALKQIELKKIRSLTRASKSAVGIWIKTSLHILVTEQQRYVSPERGNHGMLIARDFRFARDSWRGKVCALEASVNVLSTTQLALIRQVLEEIGDIAALVEVSVAGLKVNVAVPVFLISYAGNPDIGQLRQCSCPRHDC